MPQISIVPPVGISAAKDKQTNRNKKREQLHYNKDKKPADWCQSSQVDTVNQLIMANLRFKTKKERLRAPHFISVLARKPKPITPN